MFFQELYDLALDGGDIWAGTNAGIYRITGSQLTVYTLDDYLFWGNGPAAEDIAAIAVDDEYVWFGPKTNIFEGFPRYEKATGTWKNDIPFSLTFPEVLSMAIFRDWVWVGTLGLEDKPGLYIYNKVTEEWEEEFIAGDIIFHSIWAITPDTDRDYIWFGTSVGTGLYDFGRRQWQTFTEDDGLISNNVQDIAVDSASVWFATGGGIIQGKGGLSRFADATPPVIFHAPVVHARPVKQPVAIEAEIVDNLQVVSPRLHYRSLQGSGYVSVPMSYQFGDVWSASIPGSEVAMGGMAYYISVSDGYQFGYHPWRYPVVSPHTIFVYDDLPPIADISMVRCGVYPQAGYRFCRRCDRRHGIGSGDYRCSPDAV
jgi:hypothetical protein